MLNVRRSLFLWRSLVIVVEDKMLDDSLLFISIVYTWLMDKKQ